MNKDQVKEWIAKSCDEDKVSAWCNGFWTITQEELERFAKLAYDAGAEQKNKPMTDERVWQLMRDLDPSIYEAFRLSEAEHGIK